VNKYDAIVVGAAHNGLTNAAYLAKAGLKVAVLERNPHIGNAMESPKRYEVWCYSNYTYV
jgi:phytoene dehydrogenase-like protein